MQQKKYLSQWWNIKIDNTNFEGTNYIKVMTRILRRELHEFWCLVQKIKFDKDEKERTDDTNFEGTVR